MKGERVAAWALAGWLAAGVLLRATQVRDSVPGISLVFYTTPWPVIAAGLLALTLHACRQRRRRLAVASAFLAAAAVLAWIAASWRWTPESAEPADLRIVLWNVSRPEARLPRITGWLRAHDADVIAIAEAEPRGVRTLDRWRAAFPEYRVEPLPGNMLCLVRGEVLARADGELGRDSFYGLRRVRIRAHEFTVLQVDLVAKPLRSRRPPIEALTEMARAEKGEALIVLGDMNTPRESAHFDRTRRGSDEFVPLRALLTQCFEAAGRGFAETWPLPLPVLSLDQVWVGGGLRPLRCRHPWVALSDHLPVVVDLAAQRLIPF
jgi:vancomycin resistance protein VanJ